MKIVHTAFDPRVLAGYYEYRNVATGEVTTIPKLAIQQGFDTVLKPGCFYFSPNLEFSYFCERIVEGIAALILVESYQHGLLFQVKYEQAIEYQTQFLEITDDAEIARLKRVGASIHKFDAEPLSAKDQGK